MTDKLLNLKEASSRLGISTASMRRLIRGRHMRGTRILRRVLIPESEVARVIREGAGRGTTRRRRGLRVGN